MSMELKKRVKELEDKTERITEVLELTMNMIGYWTKQETEEILKEIKNNGESK